MFEASSLAALKQMEEYGGESRVANLAWSQLHHPGLAENDDAFSLARAYPRRDFEPPTVQVSERVTPRLSRNEILAVSAHPLRAFVRSRADSGLTQHAGQWTVIECEYPIPFDEYKARAETPWPTEHPACVVVYADPPWPYANAAARGAAEHHYRTMSLADIRGLPVPQLVAAKAHLHLWATAAFLPDAFVVIRAWGFTYKSCFAWVKPVIGCGNYWRLAHELLLLGVRGRTPFRSKRERSWQELRRGRHSGKPERVRAVIERVSPGPFLELFGRKPVDGWVVFGDAIERGLFDLDIPDLSEAVSGGQP